MIRFEQASEGDISALLSLCRRAAQAPGSHWDEAYPDAAILLSDLEHGGLYKIFYGENLMGLISMGLLGELAELPWPEAPGTPWELARFGLAPEYQGLGLGQSTFQSACKFCFAQGAGSLRFLVSQDNLRLQQCYTRCGAACVGQVRLWEEDFLQFSLVPMDDGCSPLRIATSLRPSQ
jgi:RimJ/RimL family protein N-acetyltransferase